MSFRERHDPAAAIDPQAHEDGPQAEYRISLTLAVTDVATLWSAAAAKAMQAPGTTIETVLDTIGPREAPSISECIAMLAAPAAIPGCVLDDFWIDAMPGLPSRAELRLRSGAGRRG